MKKYVHFLLFEWIYAIIDIHDILDNSSLEEKIEEKLEKLMSMSWDHGFYKFLFNIKIIKFKLF